MRKLKLNYSKIYSDIKYKLSALFLTFIVFLTSRLYLYADIKKLKKIFENPTAYGVIPFYFTEIVLTIAISYILFSVSKMERNSTTLNNRRSKFISSEILGLNNIDNFKDSDEGNINKSMNETLLKQRV